MKLLARHIRNEAVPISGQLGGNEDSVAGEGEWNGVERQQVRRHQRAALPHLNGGIVHGEQRGRVKAAVCGVDDAAVGKGKQCGKLEGVAGSEVEIGFRGPVQQRQCVSRKVEIEANAGSDPFEVVEPDVAAGIEIEVQPIIVGWPGNLAKVAQVNNAVASCIHRIDRLAAAVANLE